jgi:hypothetical protein
MQTGFLVVLLFCSACSALASTFHVNVDTSSFAGSIGGIYFSFSPGLASDPASVSIGSFAIDAPGGLISGDPNPGVDVPPGTDGDVTGSLNSLPLMLGNSTGLNDYLQYLKFGNTIKFNFTFNLPATFSGDPSSFGFEITGADGVSSIFPVDANNFNVQMTFDRTGTLSYTNTTNAIALTSAVPEPGSIFLLATVAALAPFRKRLGSLR